VCVRPGHAAALRQVAGRPPRYAAGLFGTLAGGLERVELHGEPAWTVAGDTAAPPRPHCSLWLLPSFDA
jgi:hypothetical protein